MTPFFHEAFYMCLFPILILIIQSLCFPVSQAHSKTISLPALSMHVFYDRSPKRKTAAYHKTVSTSLQLYGLLPVTFTHRKLFSKENCSSRYL